MMYKLYVFLFLYSLLSLPLHASQEASIVDKMPLMWGFAVEGFPDEQSLFKLQQETELCSQIIVFYLQWPDIASQKLSTPIHQTLSDIWQSGAVACITWEPMYYKGDERFTIAAEDITAGKYNTYLDAFAEEIKRFEQPLMIRFAHEMNLEGYHWGSEQLSDYGPKSPEKYISMYRYVFNYLKKRGAGHVLWVFCPNTDSVPYAKEASSSWNLPSAYYPGDTYVDILGMDGYNWADGKAPLASENPAPPHLTFEQVFTNIYQQLKKLSPTKPLFVFETATATSGQERYTWIKEALKTAKIWKLTGMVWFQVDKEKAWSLKKDLKSPVSDIKQATSASQLWINSLAF